MHKNNTAQTFATIASLLATTKLVAMLTEQKCYKSFLMTFIVILLTVEIVSGFELIQNEHAVSVHIAATQIFGVIP